MLLIKELNLYKGTVSDISFDSKVINTVNAYSFNIAIKNIKFAEAIQTSDILLPDGISIVWTAKLLYGNKLKKIAGADVFFYFMDILNRKSGKCFFLGSTNETLNKIEYRQKVEYPNVQLAKFSPPFKREFSDIDNMEMLERINKFSPDVLFVGMTAPKQELWVHEHKHKIKAKTICSIGAVFDFYAGTVNRAPIWMIDLGLEWLYRLVRQPKRLWRRYLIGNTLFLFYIIKELFFFKFCSLNSKKTSNSS